MHKPTFHTPKMKLFGETNQILYLSLSLPVNWFRYFLAEVRMKRESGENPGQSRCCETLIILKTSLFATGK